MSNDNNPKKESKKSSGQAPEEKASKTLASILYMMADRQFTIEDQTQNLKNKMTLWHNHVREGSAAQEIHKTKSHSNSSTRDWPGLLKYFDTHRETEFNFVNNGFEDLKSLIWKFVQATASAAKGRKHHDKQLLNQLEILKRAVNSDSIKELKKEARTTISVISSITDQYQQEQDSRLKNLGAKLKEMRQKLSQTRQELSVDKLTRLYNRGAFDERLEQVSKLSIFSGKSISLLLIDIDFFKKVNDVHGHVAGDEILRQIGDALIDAFPRQTDFVARYGGEEFIVILEEDDLNTANALAGKLVKIIDDRKFMFEEKEIPITISIGTAELHDSETNLKWIERADKALYKSKENGRNQFTSG